MRGRRKQGSSSRRQRLPKRGMDWFEGAIAWLLIFGGLVGSGVALMFGLSIYGGLAERARTEAATRAPVPAVLLQDTTQPADPQSHGSYPVTTRVRWTGPDGVQRVGETAVSGGLDAGRTVTVWADRNNNLVPAPTSTSEAVVAGIMISTLLLGLVVAVLMGIWGGVRSWIIARDCADWEREWAAIEPVWSGRIRGSR